MRKLATIRRIDSINFIPGADSIECATVRDMISNTVYSKYND